MKAKYIKPVTEKFICQCQNTLLAGSPDTELLDNGGGDGGAKRGVWTYDERVGEDNAWGSTLADKGKSLWDD